jgi:hypothetical protein
MLQTIQYFNSILIYFPSQATGLMLEYEGSWIQGVRQGHGIREYLNGERYEGDFVAGARHGHGRYSFTNGDVYAGEWVDDRRTGHGTYFYSNGDIFVGEHPTPSALINASARLRS